MRPGAHHMFNCLCSWSCSLDVPFLTVVYKQDYAQNKQSDSEENDSYFWMIPEPGQWKGNDKEWDANQKGSKENDKTNCSLQNSPYKWNETQNRGNRGEEHADSKHHQNEWANPDKESVELWLLDSLFDHLASS